MARVNTLSEVVEQYLLRKGNDRLKYFSRYFSIAEDVYRDIYRVILPVIKSKYIQVFKEDGEPYPFVNVPDDLIKFYTISVTNKNKELIQVFYNDKLNVFTKPPIKKSCGCVTTDLCDCVDNLQVVITPKVINDVTYYEKVWVECCSNGEVLQYSEIPVKKYGNGGGDYGNDYGDDYDIIDDGDNVVVLKFTKNLGVLDTKDCGCLKDTTNNKDIIFSKCGCFLPLKPACCAQWYRGRINCTGDMKFSECGQKIYLRNVFDDDGFVVISYQADPVKCGEEIVVNDYEKRAIWDGIEFESVSFVPNISPGAKREAERKKEKSRRELFEYNNPLNRDRLFSETVTAEIRL